MMKIIFKIASQEYTTASIGALMKIDRIIIDPPMNVIIVY